MTETGIIRFMDGFDILNLEEVSGPILPEWIRILPLGKVDLADGREPLTVTSANLQGIVAAFTRRGVDLVVDYEHQSLLGERAPAAGWIKELQARDNGLWGRVEWTKQAQDYLAAKEYRYFSPVLRLDPETRQPLALLHVGLTNTPAINHLDPLVAKANEAKAAQEARAQKYGIGIKDGGNVGKPGEWASVPDEEFGDPVNYRYPMPDAKQARAAWSYWNQAGNQDQYSEAERAIIEKRIKSRAKAVGMQIEEKKAMKEKVTQLLALKAEATDDEVFAALETRLQEAGTLPEIGEILGLKADEINLSTIKGAILALKQGQESLAQVQADLAALKAESAKRDAAEAVTEALKAGKLQPSQKEWALEYAVRDLEGFKTFVDKAPKIVPVGEDLKVVADTKEGQDGLTSDELAVCKALGISQEAFKAEKTKQAAA